ncbi:MAG: hypothetical protein C5B50_05605 [Verrucomicrobia bacterium]|nr:MAG: hypothetical protein C5B50_05605 [Verrucomicrobiota bacterium]
MSLRVILQMISGCVAIAFAPIAASVAKRLGGSRLVSGLAIMIVPFSIFMALAAGEGKVTVSRILLYGIGIALIQAFSFPANEEFLCRLVLQSNSEVIFKTLAVKIRNFVQFIGRIVIWIGLAFGVLSLTGVSAATSTYRFEAGFMLVFSSAVLGFLGGGARLKAPPENPVAARLFEMKEPWRWNHPLVSVLALEFSLNCFFMGALMLPRLLPDKSLTTLYYVMSLGALGAMLGTHVSKMAKVSLWTFVFLDIVTALFTYCQRSSVTIALGWCLANICYGATDTIFARAVQAGTSDRTANLASLRRVLMAGGVNFTIFGIVQLQRTLALSDRIICLLSSALTVLTVTVCWLNRRTINQALDIAVHT